MRIDVRPGLSLGVCLCLAAAVPSSVRAQTESAASNRLAEVDNSALAEVTVTARRKEESIQSVPVSVTAINAETLREVFRPVRTAS